ncbi:uncharacterized protein LOC123330156 [Bubalus bubalis]|uniref:uncharacterized protein LOC123330156 n=1 Tax=Bubalus bubalis TaxID=89462 RepID=UPI001E1B7266|nr:uncharacterized protein LOC123330156 [Bubalus bubalis]
MASLRSPRLLLHFKIQLLPPPVPGLSLGKAPAKVFPTRRTLGLGVLDQKWWAHSSARPADSVKSSSSEHLGVASWPLVYLAVSPRPPHLFHFEGIQARNGTSVPRTEHQTPSTRRRPSSVQLPAQPPGSWRRPPSALPASALAPPGGQCGVRTALLDWRRPPQPSRDPDSRPPSSHYIGLSLPTSLLHPKTHPPPFTQPAGLALPSLTQSCEDVSWGPSGARFQPSLGLSSL